ncbi:hypothetical protein ACLB2K_021975 [Fragaria x ananassa]
MENQIQEFLEKKLIRPSNSPHHVPAFLVRNHVEQLRGKATMVIDYRDVNKKTVKDGYQIAQVRVLINRLKGAKIFSKFDAKSGFWQVKMHPDSIALTAFGIPQGHYEWLVMLFGLKQAPSIFQRKMDNILKSYSDFCLVYIDDILVFSKTMNEHLKHLEQVCKLIVKKGIILGQKRILYIKGKFNAAELNYSTGDKEVLALIKSIKSAEAFLGNKSIVRTDNKRVKNFKNYKLTDAADRGRVLRWQMFLTQYEYDVEMVAGDKNYLPDALTREMTMFEREDLLTDQSQGKRLASPSQTADGKGISSPLMAAALPKSRRDALKADKSPLVTGKKVIHDQPLKIFQIPVFRTERLLPFKQKIIIDNILYSFYEDNEAHLLQTLKALTEEMYGFHTKDKGVLAESSKVEYLENPESAKIPILALKESKWYKFHNLLGEGKNILPGTLSIAPGPYYGRYLVDVQAEHPQKHKAIVENGFVHNLWTKTNEDLKGLLEIIAEAVKNIRPDGCILRLKFISTPPKWVVVNNQMNYISPYHHVRLIQSSVQKPPIASGNGRPNQSIPWMKAMTIAIIKDVVLRDYDSSLLASGEKIMVTCYNHPPPENCDFFTALMRKEVDCTLATTTWLEKVETDDKYKISYLYDSDLDDGDIDTARDWEYSGPNSSMGYSEDPETYHNIVNMLEN